MEHELDIESFLDGVRAKIARAAKDPIYAAELDRAADAALLDEEDFPWGDLGSSDERWHG